MIRVARLVGIHNSGRGKSGCFWVLLAASLSLSPCLWAGPAAAILLEPGKRELFLDEYVLEKTEDLVRSFHRPRKRGIVLKADIPSDGTLGPDGQRSHVDPR